MRVFISWSGESANLLAEALKSWLPGVLLGKLECFVSSEDIQKGDRGLNVIGESLQEIDFGLVVLTKENQTSQWINFEAGALGKSLGSGKVAPLLVDITQADVTGPLVQFQMTSMTSKEDVWRLVVTLTNALGENFPLDQIKVLFDHSWPQLEAAVARATEGRTPRKTTRPESEILEEILYRVRQIEKQRPTGTGATSRALMDLVTRRVRDAFGTEVRATPLRDPVTGGGIVRVLVKDPVPREEVPEEALLRIAEKYRVSMRIDNGDQSLVISSANGVGISRTAWETRRTVVDLAEVEEVSDTQDDQ